MNTQLILRKINLNKASDRIRISKWTNDFEAIYFWTNPFNLLWIILNKWNSNKVFLISKEFNILGLILYSASLNKDIEHIDIGDLYVLKKNLSLRENFNKIFIKFILNKVDLVVASSNEINKNLRDLYDLKIIKVIEDELDYEFLPNICSIEKNNILCIGWFGNSGYLSNKPFRGSAKKILKVNSSLDLISKIIKKAIISNKKVKFKILTNHIKQVHKYFSNVLGKTIRISYPRKI